VTNPIAMLLCAVASVAQEPPAGRPQAETILRVARGRDPYAVFIALAYAALDQPEQAEPYARRALVQRGQTGEVKVHALWTLAAAWAKRGNARASAEWAELARQATEEAVRQGEWQARMPGS